jgi:hypothetical protein
MIPYRSSTAALTGALAVSTLAAGVSFAAQGLAWPKDFAPKVTDSSAWNEHKVEGSALRFRVFLPPEWKLSILSPSDDQIFTASDLSRGFQVSIESPSPTSFNLDKPLPNETVQAATTAMREALSAKGYDVTTGGQIVAARQVWVWQEARMQTAALGSFAKLMSVGSGSVWVFTATPRGHRVTLRCFVLYPSGATTADLDQKTRLAGGIFATVLDRLVIEER